MGEARPWCAFMDESGSLTADGQQPFFGLGLLLLEDAAGPFQELLDIKSRMIQTLHPRPPVEFKFAHLKPPQVPYYREVVECMVAWPAAQIVIGVYRRQVFSMPSSEPGLPSWNLYQRLATELLSRSVGGEGQPSSCVVLADYLCQPLHGQQTLEAHLCQLPFVENALLLESHTALPIQAIDLVLGAVLYQHKVGAGVLGTGRPSRPTLKADFAERLASLLGLNDLAEPVRTEVGGLTFEIMELS